MDLPLYPPAVAAGVTLVSEDMQRSLRKRFQDSWDHAIGVERNGRWLFSGSDLIALAHYSMLLHCRTSAGQASHYAALLRKGLNDDPDASAVTITVGWPGDRWVTAGTVPFDPSATTPSQKPVHFKIEINVTQLRDFVRKGLEQLVR